MPKDSLSKRIRDLTRLLALDTLPETTRSEKERALQSLVEEKAQGAQKREETRMVQRYKMVKFVEHQKAVRRLAKATKAMQLADTEQDRTKAAESIRQKTTDLTYIENYPTLEKYISLYKHIDESEPSADRRRELWKMAERGTLKKSGPGSIIPEQATDKNSRDKASRRGTKAGKIGAQVDTSHVDDSRDSEPGEEADDFFE